MGEFAGRHAVVTGAAHGIGAAVADLLAAGGATLSLIDRDGEGVARLAERLGADAHVADATDEVGWQRAFADVRERHARWSVLVNNVGGARPGALEALTLADWQRTLAVNLTSAFIGTSMAFEPLRRAGGAAVVNVASLAGRSVSPVAGAAYAAAKAGVLSLTRQTAFEWARYGIRANAVCPGPTRTLLTADSRRSDSSFPLGRWVEARDVAETVVHLASPRSAMTTGIAVDVDGGVGLGPPSA